MNFTKDQTKVLTDESERLLVSASAGSGKTATIIEKMVKIIAENHVEIDKILSITFTEAASIEMKMRLKDALKSRAENDNFVREQYEKLSACDISTLHGYCSKMIRKYFYYLQIKPNFMVLDENNSQYLKANALMKTINFYSKQNDEEFVLLSSIFESGRSFEGLKSSVLSLYEFLCATENREEYKQNIALSLYDENLKSNPACLFLNKYITSNFGYISRAIIEMLNNEVVQNSKTLTDLLSRVLVQISEIKISNDFEKNERIVANIVFPSLSQKGLDDDEKIFYEDDFKPFWYMIKERFEDIVKFTVFDKDIKNDLVCAKRLLSKLIEVEGSFEDFYNNLKENRNTLDFADLENYFLKLLEFDEVKNSINFNYIFVDEYQDINPVQEKIISEISKKSNVVMVGDIKQSIYGFRNSTPEIFVEKSERFKGDNDEENLVILNENFRSNPEILNFVNSIFEKCMSVSFGGVDYKKFGRLCSNLKYESCSDIPVVELNIIDSSKDKESENEVKIPKVYSVLEDDNDYTKLLTESKKEAMIVAKKIIDIYNKPYYDAKEKTTKLIKFSDIAILCRNNEYLKEIAKTLLDYKIPIATNLAQNVYSHIDVQVLLSLLKVVNNFHDDVSLCTFMTSYIGKFSFDELTKIRQQFPDEKFFYNCVKNYEKGTNIDENISQKICGLQKILDSARENLAHRSLYEILTHICDMSGYFDFILSLPDGTNRSKIVKDFVSGFLGAEYNYDLVGFLDFVKNYAETNKFKTTFTFGDDSVKMGTIHSSKGLEYPVVFLVGCGKMFSTQTFKEDVLKDKDFGLGIYSFDFDKTEKNKNVARSAITIVKRRQERAEELRLLYVALTRAKNHLFVVGVVKLANIERINIPGDAEGVNNYYSWILSSLSNINFKNLVTNKKSLIQENSNFKLQINVFTDENFEVKNYSKTAFDFSNIDKNLVKKLKKSFEYKFNKRKNIALKNSVSSLLKENAEREESINFEPKSLEIFESENKIKRSELGTIYHKILEQIDYEKSFTIKEYSSIISKLKLEQFAQEVSFEKISNCVNTIQNLGKIKTRKEVPFISYLPYNEVFGGEENTKILVQGVADLIVQTGDKNYLVDYKITRAQSADQLVEKYKIQLKLYKICLEKAMNINFDGVYVYSFFLNKLIKLF